jgi:hypothetical protein
MLKVAWPKIGKYFNFSSQDLLELSDFRYEKSSSKRRRAMCWALDCEHNEQMKMTKRTLLNKIKFNIGEHKDTKSIVKLKWSLQVNRNKNLLNWVFWQTF